MNHVNELKRENLCLSQVLEKAETQLTACQLELAELKIEYASRIGTCKELMNQRDSYRDEQVEYKRKGKELCQAYGNTLMELAEAKERLRQIEENGCYNQDNEGFMCLAVLELAKTMNEMFDLKKELASANEYIRCAIIITPEEEQERQLLKKLLDAKDEVIARLKSATDIDDNGNHIREEKE